MIEISPDMVKSQLERILASSEFMASNVLSRFLHFVVNQSLNGQSGSIKQYTVAVEALGYGAGFDPQSNPIVRINARKLRRALDRYYLEEGRDDPVRIDIPKGSYVPNFRENQKTSVVADSSECPPPVPDQTPHRLSEPSIAVVMFENLNEKDENSFLVKGLTSEILISLTRFSGLTVLGPLDPPEDKAIDFYKILNEYNALFVLQGKVRSQGSNIRITADLTDASTGKKEWGRTFDYDLEKMSLFEIEDQVTSQVTGVVADGLGIIFRKIKADSYHKYIKINEYTEAVLHYNSMWTTLAPQDFINALLAVNKALDKQPENALLLALKSNIYYGDVIFELSLFPKSRSEMEALAFKASSLDPDLQIARYNRVVQHGFHGRGKQCIEEAQKVVAMNPNHARILGGCAVQTASVEAYDLGRELIERAKKLNPHYPGWYHFVDYLIHFSNERYKQAWDEAQNIHIEGLFWHPLLRAAALGKLGRVKEAEVYIDELVQMKPEFTSSPREYLKLLFVTEKHVKMVWDGLYKAGMRELA